MAEQKIAVNTFNKGINKDIDPKQLPEGYYIDAVNMTATGDGNFFALETIRSSQNVGTLLEGFADPIISTSVDCLYRNGVYAGQTADELTPSVFVWLNNSGGSLVKIFNTVRKVVHTLTLPHNVSGSGNPNIFLQDPDYEVFTDQGYSTIIISNGDKETTTDRALQIKCIIEQRVSDNTFITPRINDTSDPKSISLFEYFPCDELTYYDSSTVDIVQRGGRLLSGTYQFVYRYYNTVSGVYSKWSLPTQPVPIFPIPNKSNATAMGSVVVRDDFGDVSGGLPGEITDLCVNLKIANTSSAFSSYWNAVQLGVIKNVNGSKEIDTRVYITEPSIDWKGSDYIKYTGFEIEVENPIEEVAVPFAPITGFKTLTIKDNRIIAGNVTQPYYEVNTTIGAVQAVNQNIAIDRPFTAAAGTSVGGNYTKDEYNTFGAKTTDKLPGYKNHRNNVSYRGYFRNESYRFGIVYFDKYGNASPVKHLTDFTFPDRRSNPIIQQYAHTTANGFPTDLGNQTRLRAMGLRINNITNHPSWAVGFAIVRALRVRNVVYQSPFVNAIAVQPAENIAAPSPDVASAISPLGSFIPKKLTTVVARNVLQLPADKTQIRYYNQDSTTAWSSGTAATVLNTATNVGFVFPLEYLANNNGVSFETPLSVDGLRVRPVDIISYNRTAFFDERRDTGSGVQDYVGGDTDASGRPISRNAVAFRADRADQYYYGIASRLTTGIESFLVSAGLTSLVNRIKASIYTEYNKGEYSFPISPMSFARASIIASFYGVFGTGRVSSKNYGEETITQKALALSMDSIWKDLTYYGLAPSVGNPNAVHNLVVNDSSTESLLKNSAVTSTTGAAGAAASWGECAIVNIEKGLPADVYGDVNKDLDYIYTGTYVNFRDLVRFPSGVTSSTNITVDVWGGDCFISKPYFKVNDSSLGCFINQNNTAQLTAQSIPDLCEVLSCYVESEVNGDLIFYRSNYPAGNSGIVEVSGGLSMTEIKEKPMQSFRSEFQYQYNFAYSLQNTIRVFRVRSLDANTNKEYTGRIYYSDVKTFQSKTNQFNRFRAASYRDTEETLGGVTKLVRMPNNEVYAIYSRGISYIPINKSVAELGDGSQFIINSADVINQPKFVSVGVGTDFISNVKVGTESCLIIDTAGRSIVLLKKDGTLDTISNNGMFSYYQTALSKENLINPINNAAFYDEIKSEYHIGVQGTYYVYSELLGFWVSRIDYSLPSLPRNATSCNSKFYIIGQEVSPVFGTLIEEAYNGVDGSGNPTYCKLFGQQRNANLRCSVNSDYGVEKIFNNFAVDISNNITSYSISIEDPRNEDTNTASYNIQALGEVHRQNLLEFPLRRMGDGARPRGGYMITTLNFLQNKRSRINKLYTKYNISHRPI